MLKKRKGAALVAAIAIMAILTILGTTLLNLSLFETNMIARQNRKMQAFYYARAGAETVIKPFISSSVVTKPISGTVKFNFQNGIFTTTTSDTPDCKVTLSTSGNTVTIISIGTYLKESKTVKVTMNKIEPSYGHDLEWYDRNSGHIKEGDHSTHVKGSVVIKPDHDNSLKFSNSHDNDAVFRADAIFLDTDFETPDHNKLTLVSETVVLTGNVSIFSAGSSLSGHSTDNADILLKLASGKGIVVGAIKAADGTYLYDVADRSLKYGMLYRKVSSTGDDNIDYKRYYFPDNTSLRFDTLVGTSKLIEMKSDDPNWNVPDYNSIYKIIWSE